MLAQHARRTKLKSSDKGTSLAEVVDARLGQHGIDAEKISPQSVAAQIVAAIEADAEEVLADPTSEMVKGALANDLTALYPALQAQWDAVAVSR